MNDRKPTHRCDCPTNNAVIKFDAYGKAVIEVLDPNISIELRELKEVARGVVFPTAPPIILNFRRCDWA